MSQVYTQEPPTKGKVVLRTTLGDLDVELWPKEAPRAVRNFVQLCVEGYYDGTPFHRVIKDFMVQGGDPTGTGTGGESIYGRPFKDEFHTRIRFNHRGLVACANQNKRDTNGSQFFITLDRADHCNNQYTIFGKVTGDTIYNLSRFAELEVGDDDRPLHPPLLTRADVLWNPFDDLAPRVDRDAKEAADKAAAAAAAAEAKRAARQQGKNFALMSFGDEAEEEDAAAAEAAAALRIRSAHDALEDARLAKQAAVDEEELARVRERVRAAQAAAAPEPADGGGDAGGDADFASRMRSQLQARRKAMGVEPVAAAAGEQQQPVAAQRGSGGSGGEDGSEGEASEEEEAAPRKRSRLAEQGRGARSAAAVVAPSKQIKVADSELLTDWERKRQEYKQRKRLGGGREKETLARLATFQRGLQGGGGGGGAQEPAAEQRQQPAEQPQKVAATAEGGEGYAGEVRRDLDHRQYLPAAWRVDDYLGGSGEGDEEDDGALDLASLRRHRLEFAKDRKDAMSRSDNVDDYVVVDPLLEAGKANFNRQQQKAKKRGTQWAGRAQG